jgi:hypothetical protein
MRKVLTSNGAWWDSKLHYDRIEGVTVPMGTDVFEERLFTVHIVD